MRPLRRRLEHARQRTGAPWDVLEKNYVLSWVLCGISRVAALANALGAGNRFFRKFNRKMGSTRCRDILTARFGYYPDMTQNPEGYERAKEAGLYEAIGKFAGEAARLAGEFILDMKEKQKASPGQG